MRYDVPPPNAGLYYDFTRDPFAQKVLDLSMANKPFPNLLVNPQFVDANGNGVPDHWSVYNPAGISATYSMENGYAKVELIESTTTVTGAQLSQNITNIAPGQIFSCRCIAKVSSPDIRAQLQISYYTEAGYGGVVGNTVSTTDATDTLLSVENAVVPPGAIRIQILLRLIPNTSGAVGIGWFKAPELIRHSTFKQPDKSAWLYGPKWAPDGLEFDGVDDYCTVENNADADITVATRERPLTIGIVTKPLVDASMFLLSKSYELTTTYQYAIYYSGSGTKKRLQTIFSDFENNYSPGISLSIGEVAHYIMTYNGSFLREYKNGALMNNVAKTGILTSRPYFYLGCKMNNPATLQKTLFYKGTISELYIGHAQPDELIHWFERTGRFEKYGIAR